MFVFTVKFSTIKRLEIGVKIKMETTTEKKEVKMKFISKLFFSITRGRPMIDEGGRFTDVVSGKSVRRCRDRFGRKWLCDSGKWSSFRVKIK